MSLSPRSGVNASSSAQEQYVYYYNTTVFRELGNGTLYNDSSDDLFQREPYLATFELLNESGNSSGFDFGVGFITNEISQKIKYKLTQSETTTSNSSTKDHAWNEISGRYVEYSDFYMPENFRAQSEDNKQASDGLVDNQEGAEDLWNNAQRNSIEAYEKMIEMGMAKEQARSILPLTVYTQVWWTASFQSIMNFIELRDEPTSQVEIQEYARVLKKIMLNVFPETTKLWQEIYWDEQE